MVSLIFMAVSLVAMAVLIWSIRLYRDHRDVGFLLLIAPLSLLWFDSMIMGLGSTIGESQLHEQISHIRYISHLLLLPAWTIAAGVIARRARLRFAQPKWVMALFCIAATALFVSGLLEVLQLKLYPACIQGTLRYVSFVADGQACRAGMEGLGEAPSGPPLVSILPVFLFLGIGLALLVRDRWPWLVVGSVIMIIMAVVPQSIAGPLFSNIAEPIIAAAALLTLRQSLLQHPLEPAFAD